MVAKMTLPAVMNEIPTPSLRPYAGAVVLGPSLVHDNALQTVQELTDALNHPLFHQESSSEKAYSHMEDLSMNHTI